MTGVRLSRRLLEMVHASEPEYWSALSNWTGKLRWQGGKRVERRRALTRRVFRAKLKAHEGFLDLFGAIDELES